MVLEISEEVTGEEVVSSLENKEDVGKRYPGPRSDRGDGSAELSGWI